MFGPLGMLHKQQLTSVDLPRWVGMYGQELYVFQLMLCYLPAGIVTIVVVSLLTSPPPRQKVEHLRMLLRTPVGQEEKRIDAGVPIVYDGNTEANALETKHPRLVHWGGFAVAVLICAG